MEMGKTERAAYDGTAEIGGTVTSITLVIVVVFLPIAMSSGLVSNIITQFCVTVIISTLFSLLAFYDNSLVVFSLWKTGTYRR
jgi:HAE1 family hydrophobic/amphiphilic exporter-1